MILTKLFEKNLLDCRNTVHCTACKNPAALHLNRKLNNKFDLIHKQFTKNNSISITTESDQRQQRKNIFLMTKEKTNFKIGDNVLARSYNHKDK